ncbi:hypothetical protein ACJRO7_003536 [Eucalyptus globulus]|uniref:RNase H type-1 domain-containing protein n=1 Tax=Eucalyptus globulus TaxID=34317 RepID=A0ABD3IWY8_EUCGL
MARTHSSRRTGIAATPGSHQHSNPPTNGPPQIWKPPAHGVIKINVDGSFLQETGEAAVACVCRDSRGALVDGLARTVRASSAIQAEAQAILQTLKHFEGKEEQEIELESDNWELAKSLMESTPVNWEIEALISEV